MYFSDIQKHQLILVMNIKFISVEMKNKTMRCNKFNNYLTNYSLRYNQNSNISNYYNFFDFSNFDFLKWWKSILIEIEALSGQNSRKNECANLIWTFYIYCWTSFGWIDESGSGPPDIEPPCPCWNGVIECAGYRRKYRISDSAHFSSCRTQRYRSLDR